MKIRSGWLVLCATLAVAACGEDPSTSDAAAAAPAASPAAAHVAPVPLTVGEVATYKGELDRMFRTPPAPTARPVRAASGAALAIIDGATNVAVARRESDGSTTAACLDDPASALQFLSSATPAAEGEVK